MIFLTQPQHRGD